MDMLGKCAEPPPWMRSALTPATLKAVSPAEAATIENGSMIASDRQHISGAEVVGSPAADGSDSEVNNRHGADLGVTNRIESLLQRVVSSKAELCSL